MKIHRITSAATPLDFDVAIKGFWDYALNRGGVLAVDFDDGRFVFCFRPLGEFAPPQ